MLLIHWTYTGHQLRVLIKEIKFLTLMHVLLDLQQSAAERHASLCVCVHLVSAFACVQSNMMLNPI
jgi:hypothetical protein